MAGIDARLLMSTGMPTTEATNTVVGTGLLGSTRAQWNISSVSAHRLMHLPPVSTAVSNIHVLVRPCSTVILFELKGQPAWCVMRVADR